MKDKHKAKNYWKYATYSTVSKYLASLYIINSQKFCVSWSITSAQTLGTCPSCKSSTSLAKASGYIPTKLLCKTFHKECSCPTEELSESRPASRNTVLLYCIWHVGTAETGTLQCNTCVCRQRRNERPDRCGAEGTKLCLQLPPAQVVGDREQKCGKAVGS